MNYTIKDFRSEFPDEKACLDYIFHKKYPDLKGYYFVKGRKCYANAQGKQIHPVKGTIFEHSSTPLTLWFYAIYLFSVSRNGVASRELQRQLGVTLKTAWRMGYQIRKLMEQNGDMLSGVVEADETYYGGVRRTNVRMENKTPIVGAVERGGSVKANILLNKSERSIAPFIEKNVKMGSSLITDEAPVYKGIGGYTHGTINHSKRQYAADNIHTNTIEGFWSQLKRSLHGTHHSVSRKHLQSYVNEFSFRYNRRASSFSVFGEMMGRI